MKWVGINGIPVEASGGVTVSQESLERIINEHSYSDPADLGFRDPLSFRAGELHANFDFWDTTVGICLTAQQTQVLSWIRDKVSILPHFQHYRGVFKGRTYDSDRPLVCHFSDNISCRPLAQFIRTSLIERTSIVAIPLLGRVGEVKMPHFVLL